jgi:hypothetical protein
MSRSIWAEPWLNTQPKNRNLRRRGYPRRLLRVWASGVGTGLGGVGRLVCGGESKTAGDHCDGNCVQRQHGPSLVT